MRLRALLETEALGLRLLGGGTELDRPVRGVMTTDLRDPSRYLSGGELVLTGLAWRRGPEDSRALRPDRWRPPGWPRWRRARRRSAAIPQDLVAACARHRLPLFAVDERVAFATITEYVVQAGVRRAGRRPGGRGGPAPAADVLRARAAAAPTRCSTCSAATWTCGPGCCRPPGGEIGGAGAAAARRRCARGWPARSRPRAAPAGPRRTGWRRADGRTSPSSRSRTGRGAAGPHGPTVLSDWLLAVEADAGDWPAERLDLLRGVTQLIAVERDRRDAARTVRRRLAARGASSWCAAGPRRPRSAARLRAGGAGAGCRAAAAPAHWQIVVARVDWADGEAEPGRWRARCWRSCWPIRRSRAAGAADRVAVAVAEDRAMALLPLTAGRRRPGRTGRGRRQAGAEGGRRSAADCRRDAGTARRGRAPDAQGLAARPGRAAGRPAARGGPRAAGPRARRRRAADDRASARRWPRRRGCAARWRRPGTPGGWRPPAPAGCAPPGTTSWPRTSCCCRSCPTTSAGRSPRGCSTRCGTTTARHRAELIPTLEAFLACDGSWTRCAARLHLHVNTLRYRIGRIEQLTGRDLARLEDKLDFFLALRMS